MEIADGIDNVASTRAGEKISSTLTEIEEEEVKKDYVQEKGEEIQAATINPSALSTELVEKREVSCRWLSYRGKIKYVLIQAMVRYQTRSLVMGAGAIPIRFQRCGWNFLKTKEVEGNF